MIDRFVKGNETETGIPRDLRANPAAYTACSA